ncbi:tyrosine-type recombinase/integrase [Spirosoma soli]|uniref:Tyrosine-type recombinase/integrase n=1 Tax=Spirosoma soli TaxID=1770529 RepID=A0ABW5MA28_9BACT
MSKATVNLFFDKRASKEGEGVIKWLVCLDRKQRLFSTGRKITLAEWQFLQDSKGRLDNRIKDESKIRLWHEMYGESFRDALTGKTETSYLRRAQTIIGQLDGRFTFDAFADAIANYGKEIEKPAVQTDLIAALLAKAKNMSNAGRIGNAINYELAAKSLRRFVDSFTDGERKEFLNIPIPRKSNQPRPVATLQYSHLTPDFLTTYEQWMQHYGKAPQSKLKAATGASLTTVGIYLRHVRAVVNDAIESGLMSRDTYPFGRNRYVIPAGANVKKALPKADIEKLKAYQPVAGTTEQRSHDLWLFSYFCNGANLTDICRLTWSRVNIKEGKLTFIRQKTARSKKQSQTPIVAHLRPETFAIIERWGTSERRANSYVFPFLTIEMTDQQKKQVIHQVVKMTNKWMGKIAEQLGIEGDVNTYSARHSFATSLLKSKAPLAFISKSLGHTNLKTTESYLGSFDDEEAKQFLNAL